MRRPLLVTIAMLAAWADALGAQVRAEVAKWTRVVKDVGIEVE